MSDEQIEYPQRGYNTEDVRTQRDAEPPRRRRRGWLWKTLAVLVLGPALVIGLWTLVTLNYTYSRGERVGFVQKFSKKGWICKTWEGELAMTTVPGTAPQLFEFSVRDDSVASAIENIIRTQEGRISLTYEQHKGVPTACFGETDYFVVEARPVGAAVGPTMPNGQTPTMPAPNTVPVPGTSPAPRP